ncbi:MAG TPA: alpha-2-macroglobulin family protein [Pyrinomonadaceae bacterium]|nr:alpha-2-macroglobulin family protein [Pyrinomonadaceae bacterium]
MSRTKRIVALALALQLLIGSFSPLVPRPLASVPASDGRFSSAPQDEARSEKGLRFRLSEGTEQPERRPEAGRAAPAERLPDEAAARILERLPPLKAEEGDAREFALREGPLPPPRAGATVLAAFPSSEGRPGPEAGAAGPLEVVRYSPSGEVPLAPQLTVTFSRPFVAVTSQAEAEGSVPLVLTPKPAGRWRWLGTRTAIFDPEGGRLPMATEYRATVPAGTRGADGAATAAPLTWTFATPAPRAVTKWPDDGVVRRDAVVFVEFDQRVEPAAVLRTVRLRAGSAEVPVRLATDEEIRADEQVRRLVDKAGAGRWLAFRAAGERGGTGALPPDSRVTVTIGPGTPSAEGPRVTTKAESFAFRTYGPLRVVRSECGWNGRCTPAEPWRVVFSNPLDREALDPRQIKVEPEIEGLSLQGYGAELHINGTKRGRTQYRVTLDASIKDQFGQTLGEPHTLTFNVGQADPMLASAGGTMVVLDPSASPSYSVYTINHASLRVGIYRVRPEQWEEYLHHLRFRGGHYSDNRRLSKASVPMPGTEVYSRTVTVGGRPDEMTETRIDLTPALAGGRGHAVVLVEPTEPPPARGRRAWVSAWVQATGIGLGAFVDRDELIGHATSLSDGRPLAGADLSILPAGVSAKAGADGLARMPLPDKHAEGMSLLVARRGGDVAFLPERNDIWGGGTNWVRREAGEALRWYVFDDRKMYRPGEEVRIKGWIRRVGLGEKGDLGALDGGVRAVTYSVQDSQGNRLAQGRAEVNALGGFHTGFKLPATPNLGHASVQFSAEGAANVQGTEHHHNFQVQEFRRPEFEVTARASEGPHFVGGAAQAVAAASYYAGGGLPDSRVAWRVTSTPASYTPPNRGDYTFGKWVPWWRPSGEDSETNTQTFEGRTDAAGRHLLRIDFDSADPPRPSTVLAEASVTDVNRQTWAAAANMLVHPSELYVGMRSPRTFVERGQPLVVETIVTDIDGRLVENRHVRVRSALLEWKYRNGSWQQVESGVEECEVRSGAGPVKCVFTPKAGGAYRVTARVHDDRERPNESELTLWVAGGRQPVGRNVAQEAIELIPDKKEYGAGETAEILVQAPFFPAEGVLTLRRSGLLRTERFRMEGPTHTLRIPIEEGYTPNVHAQVDLVGAAARTDDQGEALLDLPRRPAFASGALDLSVPPLARRLRVTATPRETALEPGGETTVAVEVRDAAGRPVGGSELAVVVVDESVLALTGYKVEDPLSVFYARRAAEVSDFHSRRDVMLARPDDPTLTARMVQELPVNGRAAGGGSVGLARNVGAPPPAALQNSAADRVDLSAAETVTVTAGTDNRELAGAIQLRSNFDALAVFAPSVTTDAAGRAEVRVKLPDSLTRFRVTAVSVAGGRQFGSGESSITARQPLMVRPSAPRFLNFGDRAELPVVVQNQTDAELEVGVAVRAAGAELTAGQGRRVRVPANDRVEVRFPVSATQVGTARFQFAASSGRHADAAQIELPVWTPATTEAFATYGELDGAGALVQPVQAPPDVVRQFGGLEVTTSSTQLQALTDAVLYLVSYPYECSEQMASRIIAVAALKDVLAAFKAEGLPSPDEMKAAVARDIKRLAQLQNDDGGFGFWRRGDESWPYVSVHVAHALARAREKGFDVPKEMLDKSAAYLRDIERRIPRKYGRAARASIIAYALNVRLRLGERDAAAARRLLAAETIEKLPLEAAGWLLAVLSGDAASAAEVAAIRRHLNNRAEETAATAHFVTDYSDDNFLLLHSSRRADGVILESLIGDQPSSDLIPKLVRGLLAHRRQGRWENTQENSFVLLALDRYFRTYEKATPDFVARAWLGQAYAGEQQFRGRSTDRRQFEVPMSYLAARPGQQNLTLSKEGAGRLYYRVGLRYAPASLKLAAADYGFAVERAYEAVDDPADVRRDPGGTWHIRAGAKVRVRLTMGAPARRYHVALTDPLPAGLEALNPALAVTGSVPSDEKADPGRYGWWWFQPWFEHQNMRDERVEAFTSLLWEGVYEYSYVARATTPGAFVVPPPKAEEMYHPETFGRGATDRVVVE